MGAQHGSGVSTVRLRLTVIKLFARWLAAEEGFNPDPIITVKPPKEDQKPVADLSEDEIVRMVKACEGQTIAAERDRAIAGAVRRNGFAGSRTAGARHHRHRPGRVHCCRSAMGRAARPPEGAFLCGHRGQPLTASPGAAPRDTPAR